MGLNDQREMVRQADEWLATAPIGSEHYVAAMEFLNATDISSARYMLRVAELEDPRMRDIVMPYHRAKFWRELGEQGVIPVTKVRESIERWPDKLFGDDYRMLELTVPVRKP
jgi:hypothetical protein